MSEAGNPSFEGTEKKVELVVEPSVPSFRGLGDAYWARLVRCAGAEILSKISNRRCDAYLLSESSLFVFDHKIVMLTCGRTMLPAAVIELLETVPAESVKMFVYERKNEVFPHAQPTSFFEDARMLNRKLPGRAFKFGHEDEHHLYLFHLDRDYQGEPDDMTLEVLMYGIDDAVRHHFDRGTHPQTAAVREATRVDRILPDFEIDDHLFEPTGYSLNGIREDTYGSIHVTPEFNGSYASFETNCRFSEGLEQGVGRVLRVFRPRSYDLVLFNHMGEPQPAEGYRSRAHVVQELDCGYEVRFLSFYRPQEKIKCAVELPVTRAKWRHPTHDLSSKEAS